MVELQPIIKLLAAILIFFVKLKKGTWSCQDIFNEPELNMAYILNNVDDAP